MEYMSLFTADGFEGEPIDCNEGVLEWVDIEKVWKLNLWEGDKIFFRLLDENIPFFSLRSNATCPLKETVFPSYF